VAICANLNLWLAPDHLWFIWVAAGWGIAGAAVDPSCIGAYRIFDDLP